MLPAAFLVTLDRPTDFLRASILFLSPALSEPPRLIVLNPRGRDAAQEFPDGAGDPAAPRDAAPHPPVNFHAYAACVRGSFENDPNAVLRRADPARPVLLLLRRDLTRGLEVLLNLRAARRTAATTIKQPGAAQGAAQLSRPGALAAFRQLVAEAPACLAPTLWLADFYRHAGAHGVVEFIPTPYPVEEPHWDFSITAKADGPPRGIFVGTREFDVPSRQHLAALFAALRLGGEHGEPVSVFNTDGRSGARRLRELGFSDDPAPGNPRRFFDERLPYVEYLRLVARHRLVFQLDRSGVPGQVAGDALLCRLPCVGGDGAVEGLAMPALSGHGKTSAELVKIAAVLLRDEPARLAAVREAQTRAHETLSFSAIAAQLTAFFAKIAAV